MDILIKNMEMPQQMESPITITIFKNGSVWMNDVTFGKGKLPNAKAVALPEHGRLISDRDVKALLHSGLSLDTDSDIDHVCGLIDGLPTIVEASNG